MNSQRTALGILAVLAGVAMNVLLAQLRSDFFRAYLPPWVYASYGLLGAGIAITIFGVVSRRGRAKRTSSIAGARYAGNIALINAVVVAVASTPVLDPGLKFPILITQWPGIYMVLGFLSLASIAIVGTLCWSFLYSYLPTVFRVNEVFRILLVLQLVLTVAGAYGVGISMFWGGYRGSSLAYEGAGAVVVGAAMEFSVIPSAISIFMVVAGTVLGVFNVFWSGRSPRNGSGAALT